MMKSTDIFNEEISQEVGVFLTEKEIFELSMENLSPKEIERKQKNLINSI